ncbi:MAG TPA: sulfurtransferase [Nitrososphaeraceae archaeon]|nr:sulfurtransferase [Nitrososphaeraceae archaeon]
MTSTAITENSYAHPEVLVNTQWLQDHLIDDLYVLSDRIRIAEVDYDPSANYNLGHIPGAVLIDWKSDINDPIRRNLLTRAAYENLLQRIGVNKDTVLVLYGDFSNWFAAFAFWVFKYYGYGEVVLLDGGRKKWLEEDRPVTKDIPNTPKGNYIAGEPDSSLRAYLNYVRTTLGSKVMVDVRSPKEFTGELLAPPEYPTEHAQRGGHIPGAVNVPWAHAVNEDGTFKSAKELQNLYESKGVTKDKEIISYCRIGERSSHTWFVLKYLLGYPNVKNYDGSWTEWGNLIDNRIER